jgi:hypothetical protein
VSTILDALKRLEKERRDDHAQAPPSMTGRVVHSSMARRRTTVLIIGGLLAIGVVAVAVWFNGGLPGKALSPKGPIPDPVAVAASPDATKKPAATALPHAKEPGEASKSAKADLPLPSRKPVVREREHTQVQASRQTVPPTYSEQIKAKNLPIQFSPDRTVRPVQRLERPMGVDQATPPQTAKTKPVSALRETDDAQTTIEKDAYDDVERLPRDTLRLQAISWSDIPSARITVIDGRILREGHSVDGYTVVQLRPEDVIMAKDGRRW